MSKIESKQEETPNENEDHVEEEEVLDEETTNKLRNLTVDDTMFTGQSKTKGQNQKGEKKSKKNKRGVDFLDYAKSNGIDVKFQYEDTTNEKREYKDYSGNKDNYNRKNKEGVFNKEEGNKPYFNKRENYVNNKEGEERTRVYQNHPSQNKDEGVEVTPQVISSDFVQNNNNNNYNNQQKTYYKNNHTGTGNSNNYHNNKKHFQNNNSYSNSQNQNQNQNNNYNQNQGQGQGQVQSQSQGQHNNNYHQYNKNSNYSNNKPQYGSNAPSNNNKQSSTNKFDSMTAQSENYSANNVNYSQPQMTNMGYNPNPYNAYGNNYNPYAQVQQEGQMNQMQNNPQAMFLYQQQMMEAYRKQMMMFQQNTQEQVPNEAGSVLETLHYYFSEENLNKDYYMRSNLDAEGFIEASNIIRFNKMKSKGVTVEMIEEILKNKSTDLIESKVTSDGQLFMRNKDWDSFKDSLVHINALQQQQQQRNLTKRGNYQQTQVNPNNNYYGGMYPGQMEGMQNYAMMGDNMNMYNMCMGINPGMRMGNNQDIQANEANYNMYGNKREEN